MSLPYCLNESVEGYIPIDKELLPSNKEEYFFVKAMGKLDFISDGDYVLCKIAKKFKDGEIGLVVVNNLFYLRKIKKGKEYFVLQGSYPIIVKNLDKFVGKVVRTFSI